MTTQGKSLEELGRRAVACKHWRWMPGMAVLGGFAGVDRLFTDKFGMINVPDKDAGMVPDFTDPATLGCLLHLVREAWVRPFLRPRGHVDEWEVRLPIPRNAYGASEAEALVAALEAAP